MRGVAWPRAVSLVNARVLTDAGMASSLRFRRRILALDRAPNRRDLVVDLDGAWVLPGLVNAHDHLELNHYGRWPGHGRHVNALEWMREVQPGLESDPAACRRRRWPLDARLLAGGLKNVLAGVTTVAQHNPWYRELRRSFPVNVLRRYGWAHSFDLEMGRAGANGEPAGNVERRHAATPQGYPFFVHLAEGVDERARSELPRLEALGCLTANTVAVHGVGLEDDHFARLVARRAHLVWCPASNMSMLARTAPLGRWHALVPSALQQICLGTDSRLTGSRDLLEELKVAARLEPHLAPHLLAMVTSHAGRALGLPCAGRLAQGVPADLVVLPGRYQDAGAALLATSRRDIALVVVGGRPRVGNPTLRPVFEARGVDTSPLNIDGTAKLAADWLARAVVRLPEPEAGVECLPCV